jgi:hypothetical protein
MSHTSQQRRIQPIGLRNLARRLSETARLTRIDLDEWKPDAPSARSTAR